MGTKKKIILVTPSLSSFIKNDIAILASEYDVLINTYNWRKRYLAPIFLLHQMYFLLRNIHSVEKIIVEFGGYWSLSPALIGKISKIPVYIVLHGTDCANIPNAQYGSLRKPFVRFFCKESYRLATRLLPVSSSLINVENRYFSDDKYSYQGYKQFFPHINTKCTVINNGIDFDFWKPIIEYKKHGNSFIAVFSNNQFLLKGGDLIIALAKKFTNCTFYIAGSTPPRHIEAIPNNVSFLGKLEKEELRYYYNICQFHLQLSIFEGFGLSLCEAMLCECIPIGSKVNVIPEIIGDSGFILKRKDINLLYSIIEQALLVKNKEKLGIRARQQITENFSLEQRAEKLLFHIR